VHVTTLRGLSKLQGQLQRLICHNALLRLSELFTGRPSIRAALPVPRRV